MDESSWTEVGWTKFVDGSWMNKSLTNEIRGWTKVHGRKSEKPTKVDTDESQRRTIEGHGAIERS
jgi:hypothetical protein